MTILIECLPALKGEIFSHCQSLCICFFTLLMVEYRKIPNFTGWLLSLEDPRKFWTYEIEVMLMTVIMKNVCCIGSIQQMMDEFLKVECVKNLCTALGVQGHGFLPHCVTMNEFLAKMNT